MWHDEEQTAVFRASMRPRPSRPGKVWDSGDRNLDAWLLQ